jgi:membrane-associated phospholipid phosphatase
MVSFAACAQNTDTTKKNLADTIKKDLFTAPDTVRKLHSKPYTLVIPGALILYGASSFVIHPIRNFDYYVNGEVRKTAPYFSTKAESYFQFGPIAMVYGLNLIGVEGKNRFIDRTAILGLSGAFLAISEGITKREAHRLRPNKTDYLSFPSGHTGTAFMGAEFLAQEYSDKSPLYTVAGYTLASATGVFRLYNRDHWFSDVVAGAGFGILSTKAAYLVYPWIRNKLNPDPKKKTVKLITPSFNYGVPGISFSMEL